MSDWFNGFDFRGIAPQVARLFELGPLYPSFTVWHESLIILDGLFKAVGYPA